MERIPSAEREENEEGPFFVLRVNRTKVIVSGAVMFCVFILPCYGTWTTPYSPHGSMSNFLFYYGMKYLGLPMACLIAYGIFRGWKETRPLLVFQEAGITTRQLGLIPWSEISGVQIVTVPSLHPPAPDHKYFGICLSDVDATAQRYSAKIGKGMRFQEGTFGAPIMIGLAGAEMKAEVLYERVQGYCFLHIIQSLPAVPTSGQLCEGDNIFAKYDEEENLP